MARFKALAEAGASGTNLHGINYQTESKADLNTLGSFNNGVK